MASLVVSIRPCHEGAYTGSRNLQKYYSDCASIVTIRIYWRPPGFEQVCPFPISTFHLDIALQLLTVTFRPIARRAKSWSTEYISWNLPWHKQQQMLELSPPLSLEGRDHAKLNQSRSLSASLTMSDTYIIGNCSAARLCLQYNVGQLSLGGQ